MRQLSRNFLSIIVSDILRRLLGFLAIAYLARTIGTAGFGLVSIGFTVLSYALIVSSAGLTTFGIREIAQGGGKESVNTITGFRMMAGVFVYTIVVIVVKLVVADELTARFIVFLCFSLIANAVLLDWYFLGKERMAVVGLSRILSASVYLLVLIIFVHSGQDIIWVAIGAVTGDSLAAIMLMILHKRENGDLRMQFEPGALRSLAGKSLVLSGGNILASLTVNLPPLVLGIMLTITQVGVYSAASKLVFFLLMLDRVSSVLLLPAASRLQADSPEKLSNRLGIAVKWIVATTLPLSIGGTLLAGKLISIVFGVQYADAGSIFQVLIWYFFFTMLHTVFTSGLIAIGKEKLYTKTMVVSVLLYCCSVVVCTKLFGTIGAAAAMAGSEAVTLLLMWTQFHRFVKVEGSRYILRTLPAAVIMGVVVYMLPSVHLIASISTGGIVYCVMMFVTRAVKKSDIEELLDRV